MKINIILITSLLAICLSANAARDEQNSASQNIAAASKFMETLLTDRETADSLLHPDFDFLFMGISPHLSNVPYNEGNLLVSLDGRGDSTLGTRWF